MWWPLLVLFVVAIFWGRFAPGRMHLLVVVLSPLLQIGLIWGGVAVARHFRWIGPLIYDHPHGEILGAGEAIAVLVFIPAVLGAILGRVWKRHGNGRSSSGS